jgi:hypothetical protein
MTIEAAAPPAVPAPRAHPDDTARTLLAGYRHVAECQACLDYTRAHLTELPPVDVLIAALAHHDSGHRYDLIHGPAQHFTPCS